MPTDAKRGTKPGEATELRDRKSRILKQRQQMKTHLGVAGAEGFFVVVLFAFAF